MGLLVWADFRVVGAILCCYVAGVGCGRLICVLVLVCFGLVVWVCCFVILFVVSGVRGLSGFDLMVGLWFEGSGV